MGRRNVQVYWFVLKGENVSADDEVRVIQGEGEVVSGFSGLTINDEQLETDTAGGVDNTGGQKNTKLLVQFRRQKWLLKLVQKLLMEVILQHQM